MRLIGFKMSSVLRGWTDFQAEQSIWSNNSRKRRVYANDWSQRRSFCGNHSWFVVCLWNVDGIYIWYMPVAQQHAYQHHTLSNCGLVLGKVGAKIPVLRTCCRRFAWRRSGAEGTMESGGTRWAMVGILVQDQDLRYLEYQDWKGWKTWNFSKNTNRRNLKIAIYKLQISNIYW